MSFCLTIALRPLAPAAPRGFLKKQWIVRLSTSKDWGIVPFGLADYLATSFFWTLVQEIWIWSKRYGQHLIFRSFVIIVTHWSVGTFFFGTFIFPQRFFKVWTFTLYQNSRRFWYVSKTLEQNQRRWILNFFWNFFGLALGPNARNHINILTIYFSPS